MKKTLLYLFVAWAIASIPMIDLFARAKHGDWYFREERGGTQYSAYSIGNGKVHFKLLVFASGSEKNFWAYANEDDITQGSRCWTHVEGASDTDYPNFMIYEADNWEHNRPVGDGGKNPNDRGWVRVKLLSSTIIVTNTYDGEPERITADGEWHDIWLKRDGTEDWTTYLEFDYVEPVEYANKTYWVGNSVHYRRNDDKHKASQTRTLAKITGGDPDPAAQLQTPFLYVLNENGTAGYGKIAVPYVSVQQPYRYWLNGTGDPIPCEDRAGMILVNSDDVVRSFYITMEAQRSQDPDSALIQRSNTVTIPAYHKIRDFAIDGVKYQEENMWFKDYRWKQLTWKIYYPDEKELMENDMFEIQRAYKADYSDAETIGLIPMAYDSLTTDTITDQQTYTYIDSVPGAWWNPVENSYQIYYRIRRASSAQWEWDTNPFATSLSYYPEREYSPLMFEADASKTYYRLADDFETSHKVNISLRVFNRFKNPARSEAEPGFNYYYLDPKQRFVVRKIMTELNDTIEIDVPRDSVLSVLRAVQFNPDATAYQTGLIHIHYTDIVSTPCVHYKYETYIDTTGVTVYRPDKPYPNPRPVVPNRARDSVVYFSEAANIDAFSATKLEYSDGVLLTWQLTDGNVGTYKIETRPAGKDTAWTVLEEEYDGSWYKDKKANPFISREWEYRLTMTYECNGNIKSVSKTAIGSRNPYGKVSGYIRYEDGTACPGIEVNAVRTSTGEAVQSVITDENGYYLLDSLLYGEGYAYAITPTSQTAQFQFNHTSSGTATITLGLDHCIAQNINFENISSVLLSGRVLYDNTTIPARDVNFLLNGVIVKNGTSPYKTDASGNFEFLVPLNSAFTVQAVKEGHTFKGDGYVRTLNPVTQQQDSLLTLGGSLPGVRIYDQTKVRLIGRVAGGRIQAEKPLGFGLSQNNLGDDLKMVFELEGDNISQIVHYNDDLARDSVIVNLRHDVRNGDKFDSVGITLTEYYKKRIIVYPDVNTGEYYVDLFPVKYKITQATARGYATLYAEGKTGETLDLTEAPLHQRTNSEGGKEVDYNEAYSIIYHSPIAISCTQVQYGMPVDYYGEKTISRQNIQNQKIEVPVVEKQADGSYHYLFGAPVFKSENYQFIVTAHEDYYYNNDPSSALHDQVNLQGGTLKVYNGLHDLKNTEIQTHQLDTLGQATITIPIDYVSFVKTGENALRVLDLSVEYEGAFIESQAFKAFVTGDKLKGQDFTASTHGEIMLLDILRDPPGSGSSAYIDAGTSYSRTCNTEFKLTLGLKIGLSYSVGTNIYMGAFAGMGGGAWSGMPTQSKSGNSLAFPLTGSYMYKHNATYTFTTSDRITTGSDPYSVGSSADVYIGATQNVLFGQMDAVQPLDSLTYVTLSAQAANGTMRTIAEGRDANGQKYYLVIGTELGATSYINSTFVYTQSYIENSLMPQIQQQRDALLMTGDSTTIAAIVQSTKKPAYWSKVAPGDEHFGLKGYYVQIKPDDKLYDDEVDSYNRLYVDWFKVLAKNEHEKIDALRGKNSETVGTWSIGGTTTVTHTENYNSSSMVYNFLTYPGLTFNKGDFLKKDKTILESGDKVNWKNLLDMATTQEATRAQKPVEIDGESVAASWKFEITPIVNFDWNMSPEYLTKGYTKAAGFTLKVDDFSYEHLNVSVYRVEDKHDEYNEATSSTRGFTNADNAHIYGSYVYFLNGGATRCPWEGPDSTRFYTPKVPLSAGTLKLENPKLDIDVHERSNVPVDQPAVFNIRMTNEGEVDYGSGNGGLKFTLKLQEGCNPKGARIMIDGAPLLEEGRQYRLTRGTIELKRVEVYAGEGYDFENLVLSLTSNCSANELARCTFSAHFMPVACPVNISAPHDNWIMNTLSPQDSTGWYMPVVIDGFDVNYKNFDHIEFQYKLATHSDDDWVNLCSYYADDSLYNAASGNKAMINGGRIENVRFYGERDPMEQQYDLRAVAFCRHGNGFITRASAVRRGIKDTRNPRVFGDPEPANAILGVGDKILLRFNEAIAGNYLDEDNNFQIMGYTNETGISTGISLHFDETENSYAESKVMRSISDKSFTVDMMVRPLDPNAEYTFFNYDTKQGRSFTFGKSADNRLFATFGNNTIYSATLPELMTAFTRVAVVCNRDTRKVTFYAGTKDVTDDSQSAIPADVSFVASAPISIGRGFAGNMMEVRLWTKALSGEEISLTNMKRLTGYERELVAYYPMDEGKGETLTDKANGATLYTYGCSWEYRKGVSLRVKKGQTIRLNSDFLSRSSQQDETLMFWFKSQEKKGSIFSAGRQVDGVNPKGTLLALNEGALVFYNYENEWTINGDYADNKWHHFVLTINRAYNNVAIYVDDQLMHTFAATKLGEISGTMYIGGNDFDGNIDDFVIFEQALPKTMMQSFGSISPVGDEMGLLAYLPFAETKENDNGILEQVFTINDQRFIKQNGETKKAGTPLILSVSDGTDVMNLGDMNQSAPVEDIGKLTKMNFDWSFNNDELLINLNMQDREINKQTIYITVRDVEDLNGNPMVSPVTWTTFVDKNALKWTLKEIAARAIFGENMTVTRSIRIINNSGKRHQYTIESMPEWLSIDAPSGSISPADEITLALSFDTDIAVGLYSDVIYLTDEDGLSEPLRIEYKIQARTPYDAVDKGKYPLNMSICAQVLLDESVYDTDPNDIVYALYHNECVGKENVTFDNITNTSKVFMTVYGNDGMNRQPVRFQLWQASTGKVFDLHANRNVLFSDGFVYGCDEEQPLILVTSGSEMQNIAVEKGWNWISLNLDLAKTNGAMATCMTANDPWVNQDEIKNTNLGLFSRYDAATGNFAGTLETLHFSQVYMVRSSAGNTIRIAGDKLPEDSMKISVLGNGKWSAMPCLFDQTTPLAEALTGYYDNATPGDLIKAHDRFATFTANKRWEGNLTALRPGEGYLFRRMALGTVTIPFYRQSASNAPRKANAHVDADLVFSNPNAATNMTMIAQVVANGEGLMAYELSPLKVYVGDELAAVATPLTIDEDTYYFLTIQCDKVGELRFEMDGQTLQPENGAINYSTDSHAGSLKAPITLRPADETGVYKIIENDHVVIIRNNEKYDVTGKKL